MENLRKWGSLIVQIAIIGLIIFFYLDRKDQDAKAKEYWENPNFKTDSTTVFVDYSKLPTPEYENYVPPRYVINYIDSTKSYQSREVVMDDSLLSVIDSLNGEITKISLAFLQQHPDASKLIYGEFSGDSLRLDLLGIDGSIRQNSFGVNYDRFRYQFREGNFRADELPKKVGHASYVSNLYGHTGYNFQLSSPILGLDYSISKGRFRLRGDASFTLSNDTQFILKTDIGYKLK